MHTIKLERSFGVPPDRPRLLTGRKAPLQHHHQVGEAAAPFSISHRLYAGWEENGAVWLTDLLLLRLSVLEPSIRFPALLLLKIFPRCWVGRLETRSKSWRAQRAQPQPAHLQAAWRAAWKQLGNIQVLVVPLCSHVRLHQESCIKQRTKRSEEGDAARGSTQHNLGSACPAQLNSAEVKIIPPSVLLVIIQRQKLLSGAS